MSGHSDIELEGVLEHPLRFADARASIRTRELASWGQVAYVCIRDSSWSKTNGAGYVERRVGDRREVRLRSGKLLDMKRRFLCECLVRNRSLTGLRLTLGRACGLSKRFYLFDDETQELISVALVWRRDLHIGVRISRDHTDAAIGSEVRAIMRGKFYAIPD